MSFTKYGLIQALDYNTLTGNASSTSANTYNTIWATGSGNSGYGQTALTQVAEGQEVTASDWANLNDGINNIALHQGRATGNGFSINTIFSPSLGSVVDYGYKTYLTFYSSDQISGWNITPVNSYGTVYPSVPTVFRFTDAPTKTPFKIGQRVRIFWPSNPTYYFEGSVTGINNGALMGVDIDFSTIGLQNFSGVISGLYICSTATLATTTSINIGVAYGVDDGWFATGFASNDWYYGAFGSISSNVLGNYNITAFYEQFYQPSTLVPATSSGFLFEIYCPDGIDPTSSFFISITYNGTTISAANSYISYAWEYAGPNLATWFISPNTPVNIASGNITIQYNNTSTTDLSAVPTNVQMVYNNRLNAHAHGSSDLISTLRGSTWTDSITFTQTVTFANANAARYFFNSGGQLSINCTHTPNSAFEDTVFHNLASNIGTVVLSSPTSGYAIIAGSFFNGVTKVGGGIPNPTISTNSGFYALTTANTTLFTQTSTIQSGSTISIIGKVNDALNPSVVTLYTIWQQVPSGNTVSAGSFTTIGVVRPDTTYIANTWGTFNVVGSVTGGTAPTNTAAPVVSGTTTQGQTLSTTNGTWTNSPTSYSYQWKRGGSSISGAVSATYTLQAADIGNNISVTVTASNTFGSGTGNSNSVGPISGISPYSVVNPSVSGAASVGSTLTCNPGTWGGTTPLSYTYEWWYSDNSTLLGTGTTYVIQIGDVGHSIYCKVRVSNAYGVTYASTSNIGPVTYSSVTLTMTAGYDSDSSHGGEFPATGYIRNYTSYYPDIGFITPDTVGSGVVYQCYDDFTDGAFWFVLSGIFSKDYIVSISVPSLGKTLYVDEWTYFQPGPSALGGDVQPASTWIFTYPNPGSFGFVNGQTYTIVVQYIS